MLLAAVLNAPALDAFMVQQDGLLPAKKDIHKGRIFQALVIAP
jgi:hypothetical protein